MDRATADYMGMLATVINALAMQDAWKRSGMVRPRDVGHPHQPGLRALHPPPRHPPPGEGPRRHLRRRHRQPLLHHRHGRRPAGIEIGADVVLKATKVDGVYSADPQKNPAAKRYPKLTFDRVLATGWG
jgi:uridylate kinase